MKVLNFLFALCLVSFLASCGGDSCEVADWVGTYTLDSSECTDPDIEFSQTLTIGTGSTEGTITVDGLEFTPNTENCTISFLGDSAKLDGGEIKLTVAGDGTTCTATYK